MSIAPTASHSILTNQKSLSPAPQLSEQALNAVLNRDISSLNALLKEGFDPNTLFTLDSDTLDKMFSIDSKEGSFADLFTAFFIHGLFEDKEMSLLFIAVYSQNVEAVRSLLEYDADPHFKMVLDEGEPEHSPLCIDAGDQGSFIEIMELLHQKGLLIEDMIDPEYLNPLELLKDAIQEKNTELVSFLEKHGYHLDQN